MQIIDADTTRRHLPFAALIDALRAMFVAGCEVPLRATHPIGELGTILLMPAWRAGGRLGIKTVAIFPGNSARGLPGLHSVYLLFDAATGVPLAQLDGDEITSRRTAAAAALAASYLARGDARRLLVVGTGRVAALVPAAMRAVRRSTRSSSGTTGPPRRNGSPPGCGRPASRRTRPTTWRTPSHTPTSSVARPSRTPRWCAARGCDPAPTST